MAKKEKKMSLPLGMAGLVMTSQNVTVAKPVEPEPVEEVEEKAEPAVEQPVSHETSERKEEAKAEQAEVVHTEVKEELHEITPSQVEETVKNVAPEKTPVTSYVHKSEQSTGSDLVEMIKLAQQIKKDKLPHQPVLLANNLKGLLERIKAACPERVGSVDILSAIVWKF